MVSYERSHPWLTFTLPWDRILPHIWLLLGEAQSKCEHIASVPLRPEFAAELNKIYLAKGVLATAAIEGNTLTEEEVIEHLEGRLDLPPSKQYLEKEIENICLAANNIFNEVVESDSENPLTVEKIKGFNRTVLNDLALRDGVVPGELRLKGVGIGRYKAVESADCEMLLQKMCDFLNGLEEEVIQGENAPPSRVATAIIKAIVAHLYLVWIHPFGDGNGRTARLIELMILASAGVSLPACHLLSDHYNQTREMYYRKLDEASKSGGDIVPMIAYAVQGFVEGLRDQTGRITKEQWRTTWENFVHDQFHSKNSVADTRRRHLLLDISAYCARKDTSSFIYRSELRQLTPRLAVAYEGTGARTLSRDINALEKMELLFLVEDIVAPRTGRLTSFAPRRKRDEGEKVIPA